MEEVDASVDSDLDLSESWNIVGRNEPKSATASIESSDGESIEVLDEPFEMIASYTDVDVKSDKEKDAINPASNCGTGADEEVTAAEVLARTEVPANMEVLARAEMTAKVEEPVFVEMLAIVEGDNQAVPLSRAVSVPGGTTAPSLFYHQDYSCVILILLVILHLLKAVYDDPNPWHNVLGFWEDNHVEDLPPDFTGNEMEELETCVVEHKELTDLVNDFHKALTDMERLHISFSTFLDISKKLFVNSHIKFASNALEDNMSELEVDSVKKYGNDAVIEPGWKVRKSAFNSDADWATVEDYPEDKVIGSKNKKNQRKVHDGVKDSLNNFLEQFTIDENYIDRFENVKNIVYVLSNQIGVEEPQEMDHVRKHIQGSFENILHSINRMNMKTSRNVIGRIEKLKNKVKGKWCKLDNNEQVSFGIEFRSLLGPCEDIRVRYKDCGSDEFCPLLNRKVNKGDYAARLKTRKQKSITSEDDFKWKDASTLSVEYKMDGDSVGKDIKNHGWDSSNFNEDETDKIVAVEDESTTSGYDADIEFNEDETEYNDISWFSSSQFHQDNIIAPVGRDTYENKIFIPNKLTDDFKDKWDKSSTGKQYFDKGEAYGNQILTNNYRNDNTFDVPCSPDSIALNMFKEGVDNRKKEGIDKVIFEKNPSLVTTTKESELHNTTDSWFLNLGKVRSKLRWEEKRSDWMFDRASGRAKQRDEDTASWFFKRGSFRQHCHDSPDSYWCGFENDTPTSDFTVYPR